MTEPREVIASTLAYCPFCEEEGDIEEELEHADLILGALAGAGFRLVSRPQASEENGMRRIAQQRSPE